MEQKPDVQVERDRQPRTGSKLERDRGAQGQEHQWQLAVNGSSPGSYYRAP